MIEERQITDPHPFHEAARDFVSHAMPGFGPGRFELVNRAIVRLTLDEPQLAPRRIGRGRRCFVVIVGRGGGGGR